MKELEIEGTSSDHTNYRINIGQNTKKIPEDLKKLSATHSLKKNHCLLGWAGNFSTPPRNVNNFSQS